MQTLIAEKEQSELLKAFDDLPPCTALSAFPSPEELQKFVENKGFWQSLKQALGNYFSAKHILEEIIVESPVGQAILEVKINKYLTLYNMLNWGWNDIKQTFEDTLLPGNTPGELFSYILENEACYRLADTKKPLDPQILYRGWCQYKKCIDSDKVENKQDVAKLNKLITRLKRQREKLEGNAELPEHILLTSLCLDVCLKSKNKFVKSKAKGYEQAKKDHLDMISRQLRRQNFKTKIDQTRSAPDLYIT
jgi:hypothetical protein